MFWRRRKERELDEELAFHREQLAAREGARLAEAKLGGTEVIKEECREQWAWARLADFSRDLRFGARGLRRNPGFAATAIVTLALGIAANVAAFGLLDAIVLRRPPYPHPGRIMEIISTSPGGALDFYNPLWAGDVADFRKSASAFEDLAAWDTHSDNFSVRGVVARVSLMRVTSGFFKVFGEAPSLGRTFARDSRPNQVVLSNHFWRGALASRPMLGKSVWLHGAPYTVVGIMPPRFSQGYHRPDLWMPLRPTPIQLMHNRNQALTVWTVGRIRTNATPEQAAAQIVGIANRENRIYSKRVPGWGETAVTLQKYDRLYENSTNGLVLLLGLTGIILLISCGGVAGLLLERGAARAQEMALRRALGAGRARMVRQLLTETLLLVLAAGALGTAQGAWALAWENSAFGAIGDPIRLDANVLGLTVALSMFAALVAGAVPAWQANSQKLGRHRLRSSLVAGEIAFSLACLAAGFAIIHAIYVEFNTPTGYHPRQVLTANLNLLGPAYRTRSQEAAFVSRLLPALASLPGAKSTALVSPPAPSWDQPTVQIRGRNPRTAPNAPMPKVLAVTPSYFTTMEDPLLAGRRFTAADAAGAAPVAIVSQVAARRFFPGLPTPVGHYLRIIRAGQPPWRQIVGVVGNRENYTQESTSDEVNVYEPLAQDPRPDIGVLLRSSGPPSALAPPLRDVVRRLDPALPVYGVGTLYDKLMAQNGSDASFAELIAVLNLMVLLLSAIGLYGVVAYGAGRRRRELAIRIALGAQRRQASALLLWSGLRLAIYGVAVGLVLAWLDSFALNAAFFGVSARSWPMLALPAAVLFTVALAASWLPARRAACADPFPLLKEQ